MTSADRIMAQLATIRSALDSRSLLWFGIRGEDAESLLSIPEFGGSYSISAPARSASLEPAANVALEELAGQRVDLDRYDLDLDASSSADAFRAVVQNAVSRPCVVMVYRSGGFISDLAFSMSESMLLAGLHADRQRSFEHKPWIETSLRQLGVATPDWVYVGANQGPRVVRRLASGPVVVRTSRDSGGVGITMATSADEVHTAIENSGEPFVAIAPHIHDAVPVNVGGCVFDDGAIRLHAPSVQLIGLANCTDRMFGFCGNDFAAINDLPATRIDELDRMCRVVGGWLHQERYRGAFGVDALVADDRVVFTEVNPRFQGSSSLGAAIAREIGEPDLLLDHLAAFLGIVPEDAGLPLSAWRERQPPHSQVIVHNTTAETVSVRHTPLNNGRRHGARATLVPTTPVAPGGVLVRLVIDRQVTRSGFELEEPVEREVRCVHNSLSPEADRETGRRTSGR